MTDDYLEEHVKADIRANIRHDIASILDHPSVYMGGPSHGNRRKADKIIEHLERLGVLDFSADK